MEKLGLYIHIPFCEKKCYYCDFYSITDKNYIDAYLDALINESEKLCDKSFTSVYIGGGSPSLLNFAQTEKLLKGVIGLNLSKCEEFTIEANPSQITEEKLNQYLSFGINRISIGVQSFSDKLLKKVGRIHNGVEAENSVILAKKAGFKNISLDFIYALPEENIEDIIQDTERAASLDVQHISAYSLMLSENAPLYDMIKSNKLFLPNEEVAERMYDTVNEKLPTLGYKRYEISNFAKDGYECKHNLLYWTDFPYIGLGAGAAGYFDNVRYKNNCSVKEYIKKIRSNASVCKIEERSQRDAIFEYIFLAFRKTAGLSKSDFYGKFNRDFETTYENEIKELQSLDLLVNNGDFTYLTPKGMKVSNLVFEKFI